MQLYNINYNYVIIKNSNSVWKKIEVIFKAQGILSNPKWLFLKIIIILFRISIFSFDPVDLKVHLNILHFWLNIQLKQIKGKVKINLKTRDILFSIVKRLGWVIVAKNCWTDVYEWITTVQMAENAWSPSLVKKKSPYFKMGS